MANNLQLFENIYRMSEMAMARAEHIKDFIAEFPEVLDVYNDPSHIKPGTEANAKWKKFIADFYELYPDDAEVGNKTPGKSFSDSIFPIVKRMKASANKGKSDNTLALESILKALNDVKGKMHGAGLADSGAYAAVGSAIDGLENLLEDAINADAAAVVVKAASEAAPAETETVNAAENIG
jgi:hypothetical protein